MLALLLLFASAGSLRAETVASIHYTHAGHAGDHPGYGLSADVGHALHLGDAARGLASKVGLAVYGESLALQARAGSWRTLGHWGRLQCDASVQRPLISAYDAGPALNATCGASATKRLGRRASATVNASASAMRGAQASETVLAGLTLSATPARIPGLSLNATANGSHSRMASGESESLSAGASAFCGLSNGASWSGGPTWSVRRWRYATHTAWGRFEHAGESRSVELSLAWNGRHRPGRWVSNISAFASWTHASDSVSESQGLVWNLQQVPWARHRVRSAPELSASLELSRSVQRSVWGEFADVRAAFRVQRSFGLGVELKHRRPGWIRP